MRNELAIGDRVGPYRIIAMLDPSAYRAIHEDGFRRAVIHLAPAEGWRETAVHMLRTARIVAALGHPGIARIVDRGVLADRRPWWASEVPNGVGLYDLIARRAMPPSEVAALVHDLADVLAHAHSRGVVHRALTLRSIVLATGERDFPLSVIDWGVQGDLGVYAAPEGQTGDGRVDVYALGVIAYRATMRRFPGAEASPFDALVEVPQGLATLIANMLATDPDERLTAAEARALAGELLAAGSDAVAAALAAGDAQAEITSPELEPFADDPSQPNEGFAERMAFPRFATPRWTPAPPITSEGAPHAAASGEIPDEREREN
jgi:serine/threonine-protein kinase